MPKISNLFKAIKAPEPIDQDDLNAYVKNITANILKIYETPEEFEIYKAQANRIIDEIIEISKEKGLSSEALEKFNSLRMQFDQYILEGSSRNTLNLIKETLETICYKIAHKEELPQSFELAVRSSSLNLCEAGALTNLQSILFNIEPTHYYQKYNFIQHLATEFIHNNKICKKGEEGNAVHIANELIHEVSRDYHLTPPEDFRARYRDLDAPITNDYLNHLLFKSFLDEYLNTRKAIDAFNNFLTQEAIGNLPEENYQIKLGDFPNEIKSQTLYLNASDREDSIIYKVKQPNHEIIEGQLFREDFPESFNFDCIKNNLSSLSSPFQYRISKSIPEDSAAHDTSSPKELVFFSKEIKVPVKKNKKVESKTIKKIMCKASNKDHAIFLAKFDGDDYDAPEDIDEFLAVMTISAFDNPRKEYQFTSNRINLLSKSKFLADYDHSILSIEDIKIITNIIHQRQHMPEFFSSQDIANRIDSMKSSYNISEEMLIESNKDDLNEWSYKESKQMRIKVSILEALSNSKLIDGLEFMHINHKRLIQTSDGLFLEDPDPNAKTKYTEILNFSKIANLTFNERSIEDIIYEHSSNLRFSSISDFHDHFVKNIIPSPIAERDEEDLYRGSTFEFERDVKVLSDQGKYLLDNNKLDKYQISKMSAHEISQWSQFYNFYENNKQEAFNFANSSKNIEMLNIAIATEEIDLNIKDENDYTALMKAIHEGNTNIAIALIEAGADLDIKTNSEITALMMAAYKGDIKTINALIEAGADLNIQNDINDTALIIAASFKHIDSVNALIAAEADLNIQDESGNTALMTSVSEGDIDGVNALIKAGADLYIEDKNGYSALMIADEKRHAEIIDRLIEAEERNPPPPTIWSTISKFMEQMHSNGSESSIKRTHAERIKNERNNNSSRER